jgi:hypothetical protein
VTIDAIGDTRMERINSCLSLVRFVKPALIIAMFAAPYCIRQCGCYRCNQATDERGGTSMTPPAVT